MKRISPLASEEKQRKCRVKEILIQQFLLHEVGHHPSPVGEQREATTEPRAHTLADIYKCLHQGEFGVGHLIDDPDRFRDRLYHEYHQSPENTKEPVLENVSLDGTIMRINLGPYQAFFRDDPDRACRLLAEVCLQSATLKRGRAERLIGLLNEFIALNRAGQLIVGPFVYVFPVDLAERFLIKVKQLARQFGEMPVFSHSSNYRRLNSPAYRVVDVSVINQSPLAFLFEGRHERPSA